MMVPVAALNPPGRLPTVVYDPGAWWSRLTAAGVRPTVLGTNVAWWRTVCSRTGSRLITAATRRWRLGPRPDPGPAAEAAGRALETLRQRMTFSSAERYVDAVTPLAYYLALLNRAQHELFFHVDFGVHVLPLDYGDSRALVDYARRDTVLARLIAGALPPAETPLDLLVVGASRPEELLTALIAVGLLKGRNPTLHACLADHSHENFTLAPHLARVRASGALDAIFDTIVESTDDRDEIVPEIAAAVASGRPLRGYVTASPRRGAIAHREVTAPPLAETFCSEPILWTRISPRRCFWDRCTFCALNAKYADPRAPSTAELPHALERLTAFVEAGYRIVNFGDEALSPALLERLCQGILDRGLDFTWACCCKLEPAYTPELFALMRAAGCYEIFWGLESISPRVLRLMDKEVPGLEPVGVRRILDQANAAGIGLHLSLMAGFPGDTPGEVAASVEFVVEALRDASNATFNLNRFMLLDGSPIMADPERFGVIPRPATGDMPHRRAYRLAPAIARDGAAVDRRLPTFMRRLYRGLGWDRFGSGPGAEMALDLHFFFGHGSIFKQSDDHAFANPLRQTAVMA